MIKSDTLVRVIFEAPGYAPKLYKILVSDYLDMSRTFIPTTQNGTHTINLNRAFVKPVCLNCGLSLEDHMPYDFKLGARCLFGSTYFEHMR